MCYKPCLQPASGPWLQVTGGPARGDNALGVSRWDPALGSVPAERQEMNPHVAQGASDGGKPEPFGCLPKAPGKSEGSHFSGRSARLWEQTAGFSAGKAQMPLSGTASSLLIHCGPAERVMPEAAEVTCSCQAGTGSPERVAGSLLWSHLGELGFGTKASSSPPLPPQHSA